MYYTTFLLPVTLHLSESFLCPDCDHLPLHSLQPFVMSLGSSKQGYSDGKQKALGRFLSGWTQSFVGLCQKKVFAFLLFLKVAVFQFWKDHHHIIDVVCGLLVNRDDKEIISIHSANSK